MADQTATYTRAQYRDLIVEFYSRVDPAKLEAGIDINGMVDWIAYHGVNDMNARLIAKYAQGLDFDILTKPKTATAGMSAMHRISMMPNAQLMEQQGKRLDIRTQVETFYKANDPAKLPQVDAFVEWIEVNGAKAFNELLMKKYNKTLEPIAAPTLPPGPPPIVPRPVATMTMPVPPTPPTVRAMPVAPVPPTPPTRSGAHAVPAAEPPAPAAAPPPPPPAAEPPKPKGPDPVLIKRLLAFYAHHEPGDEQNVEPIAQWGMAVGMDKLNEKLNQLYGGTLDTLEDDIRRANEPPPPPPEEEEDIPPPPPPEEEEAPEPAPVARRRSTAQPVVAEAPPVVERRPSVAPERRPSVAPAPEPAAAAPAVERRPTLLEKPVAPTPPVPPPSMPPPPVVRAPPVAPKPPQFRAAATPNLPNITTLKPAPPVAPASAAPAAAIPAPAPPPKKPAAPVQRKRSPSEGACDKYVLDLSGEAFGVCCCGFNKAQHGVPKVAGPGGGRRPSVIKAAKVVAERPCDQYRVDVAGKNFGDCLCGWPKSEHGKINWTPPTNPVNTISPKELHEREQQAAKEKAAAAAASKVQGPVHSYLPARAGGAPAAPVKPVIPKLEDYGLGGAAKPAAAPGPAADGFETFELDAACISVFNMMMSSYTEQHGGAPPQDTQLEWAGNLLRLKEPTLMLNPKTATITLSPKLVVRGKRL